MLESHKPDILDRFDGLFDRGEDNAVPKGHFRDCKNLIFSENGCETRFGTDLAVTLAGVRRIHTYKRPGEAARLLILNNVGEIYDSLNLITPILTIVGMTDFSVVPFFGRIYISPHNGLEGLPNEFVYLYDGTTCRRACGAAPTGSLTVATSASSGFVESGVHLFAVSFETSSGFITKPGPLVYAVYVAPGAFKVDISTIPIGPAGTVARRLLATKTVDIYLGDQDNQEYFFIPDGRIPNNTDTTLTVDFFDNDLQSSADYLFFQRESIPACLHLSSYKSRLVALNYDGGNSIALVSNAADPESISELDGFIVVDPTENDTLRSAIEFRSTLILHKSNKTVGYAEIDGLAPAEWAPETIDYGAGSEVFGTQRILDSAGANTDKFLVASKNGLLIFTGLFTHPALTWKIEDYWKRINFNAANKIQIFNDTQNSTIFLALPIDGAALPNVVLYGDYSRGLDAINIRWSPWTFPFDELCITVDTNNANQTAVLKVGSLDGNVYSYPSSAYNDDGTAIDSYFDTCLIKIDDSGSIAHCSALRIHGRGVGLLQTSVFCQDGTRSKVLPTISLADLPGKDYVRIVNFQGERLFFRIRTSLFAEHFKINVLTPFIKPLWAARPS